jgi:hypothetical protein
MANSEWRMGESSIRYSPLAYPLFLNPAEIPLMVS